MSQPGDELLKANVVKQLQKALSEIEALPTLPDPESLEALAMGGAWRLQFHDIERKELAAFHVAMMVLPDDVRALVQRIKDAAYNRMMGRKDA